jgi:hypothetical protein
MVAHGIGTPSCNLPGPRSGSMIFVLDQLFCVSVEWRINHLERSQHHANISDCAAGGEVIAFTVKGTSVYLSS